VAERTRELENSRKAGAGRGSRCPRETTPEYGANRKPEAEQTHLFDQSSKVLDEEFSIKTYQDGEFIIQAKDPYSQRHFFVEEELQLSSPEASPTKPTEVNASPKVYEVGAQNDFTPLAMRDMDAEEPSVAETASERQALLTDFGFKP
jgi:hypothetical protein